MLYFDRIDVSEGSDVNKTSTSKEYDICCYWYFLNDLSMIPLNVRDIAILNIKGSYYRCIISLISKIYSINLMQNADLTEKIETL